MIGGKFAPLTIMDNEDTDLDSMITTFNTELIETAGGILGKHRQKNKPWVTEKTTTKKQEKKKKKKRKICVTKEEN